MDPSHHFLVGREIGRKNELTLRYGYKSAIDTSFNVLKFHIEYFVSFWKMQLMGETRLNMVMINTDYNNQSADFVVEL